MRASSESGGSNVLQCSQVGLSSSTTSSREPGKAIGRPRLPDDLVGPLPQRWRDGESQRLRRLEVDHEPKYGRLLDGQITGLRAPRYPVDATPGMRDAPAARKQALGNELDFTFDLDRDVER